MQRYLASIIADEDFVLNIDLHGGLLKSVVSVEILLCSESKKLIHPVSTTVAIPFS